MAFKPGTILVTGLRDAAWLTASRAGAWCRVLAVLAGLAVLGYLALSLGGIDPAGKPVGTDFISFWAASHLALAGHPEAVYDPGLHQAAERAAVPAAWPGYFPFFYPPSFLLVCLPLALLPYFAALALWLVGGFAPLYVCLKRLLPQRWAILPILAYPGMLVNALHGQNGFLTAACLGWSMVLARSRPFLAGACLGLLVVKPHLLLAAPVALVAARRWRMIAGAACSGLGLVLASWALLGDGAWRGFAQVLPLARDTLEQGLIEPWKMVSVFAAAHLFVGSDLSYGLQIAVALAACGLLGLCALRRPGAPAEGALLVATAPFCTPFLLDYDLVLLALPIAWIAAEAQRTGWRPWEKIVLLLAYILPVATRPVALVTGLPIAPFVMLALLLVVARRAIARS